MSSGPDTPTFPPNPTPFEFGFRNIDEKMKLDQESNVESVKDEIEDEIEDFTPSEGRPTSISECREIQVRKETLLEPTDLRYFQNHSSQMAALDYLVSLESDIFVPTYDGNMAKVLEGHHRFAGFRKTILLDRRLLVDLIDRYTSGSLSWDEFSSAVKQYQTDLKNSTLS